MKQLITIILTLFVLIGLSCGISYYKHTNFIDYSFFAGLVVTVIIWFFTSKGGYFSKKVDMLAQSATGYKMEQQKFEFVPNVAFLTSLVYTIISLIVMLFQYRSYF